MTKARTSSGRRAASVTLTPTSGKVIVWLHGEDAFRAPPLSNTALEEASALLSLVRYGRRLSMPVSRPMPRIGSRTHELRIKDVAAQWRIIYRVDADAVLLLEVFKKKTRATPMAVIENCKRRLRQYDKDKTKK